MFKMEKSLGLTDAEFHPLKQHCTQRNVIFLSTAFDKPSLDFVVSELEVPMIKVPSGEPVSVPFLRKVARSGPGAR